MVDIIRHDMRFSVISLDFNHRIIIEQGSSSHCSCKKGHNLQFTFEAAKEVHSGGSFGFTLVLQLSDAHGNNWQEFAQLQQQLGLAIPAGLCYNSISRVIDFCRVETAGA